MLTCHVAPCDGRQFDGRDERAWKQHQISHHGPDVIRFAELGVGGDWRERAVAAVKKLSESSALWTFYDVARLAGEPLNPRSDWGSFSHAIEHMGLAHPVGYQQSDRPESKGSAVRTWRGGPAPERTAVA